MQSDFAKTYFDSLAALEHSAPRTSLETTLRGYSQYTFNEHSNACSAISMAMCYAFLVLHETFITLESDFSAISSIDTSSMRNALLIGNRSWSAILTMDEAQYTDNKRALHSFLTPHEILVATAKAGHKTDIIYTEHVTVCGNVNTLRETDLMSLFEIIKRMSDYATANNEPVAAALVCRGSTVAVLFPSHTHRKRCVEAPNWCAMIDSHPLSGTEIRVFKTPDHLTAYFMQNSIGMSAAEIRVEQLFSSKDGTQREIAAQKSHADASSTAPTLQSSTESVLASKTFTQQHAIMNSSIVQNTPSKQVDLLELRLNKVP